MKEKKPVYLYKEREYIGFFQSMSQASKYTKEAINVIGDVLEGKRKLTRKGYHYSQTKLTEEQIKQLPIKQELKKDVKYSQRFNDECKQIVNNFEYSVSCADHRITYQARSKEQRIKDFKHFIFAKLQTHWQTISKPMANLEKVYINEFLDSLS